MALIKKPVTGMRDIMPEEMELRDELILLIKNVYRSYGFSMIETPCVEDIRNLLSKQGGENEQLIFKILKRGEKLNLLSAKDETELSDTGLRYDLTLPLCRYYSAHKEQLPSPFKALQIGSVWRADRPQRGRFRQFTQCDIDIIGDGTDLCETELILATASCLSKIGFSDFTVRINDRRLLKDMALISGFPEDMCDRVFIILDKLDKIGLDGVGKELEKNGFEKNSIECYISLFEKMSGAKDPLISISKENLSDEGNDAITRIERIIDRVNAVSNGEYKLRFDPSLVRGMSYYTGTIFEITTDGFSGSIAGGGRYDGMIGKFTQTDVPACGFSIGFERIITILEEKDRKARGDSKRALLLDNSLDEDQIQKLFSTVENMRKKGVNILINRKMKNVKYQKEALYNSGYKDIRILYGDSFEEALSSL